MNSDLGSTQILTQHCGAQSQTISQLMNSGIVPTRQVSVVQLLLVFETPVDGVGAYTTPPFDNSDRIVGLH
jgi:hypothetical protein